MLFKEVANTCCVDNCFFSSYFADESHMEIRGCEVMNSKFSNDKINTSTVNRLTNLVASASAIYGS